LVFNTKKSRIIAVAALLAIFASFGPAISSQKKSLQGSGFLRRAAHDVGAPFIIGALTFVADYVIARATQVSPLLFSFELNKGLWIAPHILVTGTIQFLTRRALAENVNEEESKEAEERTRWLSLVMFSLAYFGAVAFSGTGKVPILSNIATVINGFFNSTTNAPVGGSSTYVPFFR
jgi:hypothetical protein